MSTVNKKKNDWFDQANGYIILAGIIAVVAGFGTSRIFDSLGAVVSYSHGYRGGCYYRI